MSRPSLGLALSKRNYVIISIGLALVIIGYMLMSGGGTSDPNVFNADELFSTRRITVAPIVVLIGYGVIGYGIMAKPKK